MNTMQTARAVPLTARDGCQDAVLLNDWHVIGFKGDFPSGAIHTAKLLGRELIVWRDSAEAIHVWEDLCVHRGARLSRGSLKNDHVICPYHGWEYDGSAKCTKIPAAPNEQPMQKARAFAYQTRELYGFVWVCLGDPVTEPPLFPEWDNANFMKVENPAWPLKATGFRAIENVIDMTHFPFVHAGSLGAAQDDSEAMPIYTVDESDEGLTSSGMTVFQPSADARGLPGLSTYTYKVFAPLVAYLHKRNVLADEQRNPISDKAECVTNYFTVQMVDDTHSIARQISALNVDPLPEPQAVIDRFAPIMAQDVEILESQRPKQIPTDLRYELHHRTDLLAQRYRTWLKSLGITYGVV